jgi:hypothetical protein
MIAARIRDGIGNDIAAKHQQSKKACQRVQSRSPKPSHWFTRYRSPWAVSSQRLSRPLAKLFLQEGRGTANAASFNEIKQKEAVK